MAVSEKCTVIKANTMRLVLSAVFTLSAVVGSFDATLVIGQNYEVKVSEAIARIDETPDRHDASGGQVSTQVSSPAAIA